MPRKEFKVMLSCNSGTIRLTNDTHRCLWETVFHIVTWFHTEDENEAREAVANQRLNPMVRNAWYELA